MQRVSAKHRALGRSIAEELDARDPSPANLHIPAINSIPIVGPLVSPLIGNGAGGGTQPSTFPNPQPVSISTAGSGSGSGNGGGGTPTPTASPAPTSGGGTVVPPPSIVPGPTPPASAPGMPPSSNSASSGGSTASSSIPGTVANLLGTSSGKTPSVNVGSGPSTTTSAALGMSTPAAQATGSPSPSQSSLHYGYNTAGSASPLATNTTAAAVSSGGQLSGGAIAGIIIACLFFLFAFILLVVRRRSIARRVELRKQWWYGRDAAGGNFSLVNNGTPRSPVGSSGEAPAGRLSARSSFATNFDQGLMFRIDSPSGLPVGVVPDLPPVAEVRERNSVLISTGGAVARRESMNSMLSSGSEPDAQYLTISTGQNNLEPSTPMSVRPFSPSETFAFPKPPAPLSSTTNSFFISGTQEPASPPSSANTLVYLSTPPRAFMTDLPPASVSTPPLHLQTSTPNVALPPATKPSIDPFVDPVKPEFAEVEVIRRPFTPSLDDELAVHPGDRVRIFQIFDDGWAFVEKLASTEGGRHERGLIPVDCLREVSQALPTFLAQNRVSYGTDQLMATAL